MIGVVWIALIKSSILAVVAAQSSGRSQVLVNSCIPKVIPGARIDPVIRTSDYVPLMVAIGAVEGGVSKT